MSGPFASVGGLFAPEVVGAGGFFAVVFLALMSGAHCATMCGCIASLIKESGGNRALWRYYTGRLVSYSVAGGVFAGLGGLFPLEQYVRTYGVWVALLSAVLFFSVISLALNRLPTAHISRWQGLFLRKHSKSPYVLGLGQVLLPCSMLMGWLTVAAATASATRGAAIMAALSIMTTPALALGARVLPKRAFKYRRALLFCALVFSVGYRLTGSMERVSSYSAKAGPSVICD